MIFSNATEYAIRGLSEVAARGSNGRLLLDDVVAGSGLPRDFMAKVFQKLVHAGVLRSAKGRGGGFAIRQMTDKGDARGRGCEQHSLLLVTHHIKSMPVAQRPGFQNVESGRAPVADDQTLPVSKEPYTAKE